MTENTTDKKPKNREILTKSLFILMILGVIVVLAFSIIKFLPLVFSSFASVGSLIRSPFGNDLVLKINETKLQSGQTFRVEFKYKDATDGFYNLSYDCAPNLKILVANQKADVLECNKSYKIAPNDTFIDLKATLDKENFYTETKINIAYFNRQQEELAKESAEISVVNQTSVPVTDLSGGATISSQDLGEQPTTSNTGSTQTSKTKTTTTRQSSIPADLVISNVRTVSNTVVVFDVSNIGGKASGNWYFNYLIPNENVVSSPIQMSLYPGQAMRLTLTFVDISAGNTIIMIDPNNLIRENSETNNSATIYVRGDNGDSDDRDYSYDRNDDTDLVIKKLEVGRMSGSRFVEDDEIDEGDDAAVRFTVANIGGESTGSWRFEITNTPYDNNNDEDYRSGRQSSLRPGESRTITIEFENADEGRYSIKVEVDSDDDVDEERENNNDESEVLEVRG